MRKASLDLLSREKKMTGDTGCVSGYANDLEKQAFLDVVFDHVKI